MFAGYEEVGLTLQVRSSSASSLPVSGVIGAVAAALVIFNLVVVIAWHRLNAKSKRMETCSSEECK